MAWPILELAQFLGISTIRQLDQLLLANQEAVVLMSHRSWPEKSIARGHCLIYLFEVLGCQLGDDGFEQLRLLANRRAGGTANQLLHYREIEKSLPKKTWWRRWGVPKIPLARDFNLIPLDEALTDCKTRVGDKAGNITLQGPEFTEVYMFKPDLLAAIDNLNKG